MWSRFSNKTIKENKLKEEEYKNHECKVSPRLNQKHYIKSHVTLVLDGGKEFPNREMICRMKKYSVKVFGWKSKEFYTIDIHVNIQIKRLYN